jgi:hypothetical protein
MTEMMTDWVDIEVLSEFDDVDKYAEHLDWCVREDVASSAHVTAEVLLDLAGDPSARVREGVARHKRVPLQALADLIADRDPLVVEAAISNPKSPVEWVLDALAGQAPIPNWALRGWVEGARCLPPRAVLVRLLCSPHATDREVGLRSLGLPPENDSNASLGQFPTLAETKEYVE